MKITKKDIIAIALLVVFIILLSIPNFINRSDCEVARPNYKCSSLKDVLIENCAYLKVNNFSDVGIAWYIQQICPLQNRYHNSNIDCSSPQNICRYLNSTDI